MGNKRGFKVSKQISCVYAVRSDRWPWDQSIKVVSASVIISYTKEGILETFTKPCLLLMVVFLAPISLFLISFLWSIAVQFRYTQSWAY